MRSTVFVLALGAVLGCSSDGSPKGGSDGESDSARIPEDKLVSELSAAEGKRLCRETVPRLERIEAAAVKLSCTLNSIGMSSCSEDVEQCVEDDAETESEPDCDNEVYDVTGGEDCNVTVEDFRACFAVMVKNSVAYSDTVDCDTDLTALPELPKPPKECTSIAPDCARLVMLED